MFTFKTRSGARIWYRYFQRIVSGFTMALKRESSDNQRNQMNVFIDLSHSYRHVRHSDVFCNVVPNLSKSFGAHNPSYSDEVRRVRFHHSSSSQSEVANQLRCSVVAADAEPRCSRCSRLTQFDARIVAKSAVAAGMFVCLLTWQ